MYWYEDLYIGQEAARNSSRIISKIKRHRILKNVYVITTASNGYDLFDIYPANVLRQKYFRHRDLLIVGIAVGHDEAVLLIQRIVEELFLGQRVEDLKGYFKEALAEVM